MRELAARDLDVDLVFSPAARVPGKQALGLRVVRQQLCLAAPKLLWSAIHVPAIAMSKSTPRRIEVVAAIPGRQVAGFLARSFVHQLMPTKLVDHKWPIKPFREPWSQALAARPP
jgi:hypothetical protein